MKKTFLILPFLFFFFYLFPQKTFAATITIVNSPSSATVEQEFNVNFSANDLEANTQYYGKMRLGTNKSYIKGETKNGDSWFGDTATWPSFPVLQSDNSGIINGTIAGRAKTTAQLGTNQLFVRLRKVSGSTNISPDGQTMIEITQATATPTPSPSPSSTSTSSPRTASPTSTAQNSPVPTSSPIGTKAGGDFTRNTPTGADVLGTNSAFATPKTVKEEVKTLGTSENNLSKIFLGAGAIIILASLGFYIKSKWIKQS